MGEKFGRVNFLVNCNGSFEGKWSFIDYKHIEAGDYEDEVVDEDTKTMDGECDRSRVYLSDSELQPELFGREEQPVNTEDVNNEVVEPVVNGLDVPGFIEELELHPYSSDDEDCRPKPPSSSPNIDIESYMMKPYENFGNAKVFRQIVRELAIRDGRNVAFVKNESKRVTVQCVNENCDYRLHASLIPDSREFMLKSWHFEHSCAPDYTSVPVSSTWVLKKFINRIRSNPKYPISAIIRDVGNEFNVDISVNQAYKVKKDAMTLINDDHKVQFGQLWDYCNALMKANNDRVCVKLKFLVQNVDNDQVVFQRIFISFEAAKNGLLAGCRKVVGLDGTFLKGPYGGILLTATCNDGNNNCMLIAYAVVENECYATWRWFMDHFIEFMGHNWCFISNGKKGLQRIFENDLEGCDWRICCRHLYANFRDAGFGDPLLKQLMWNAARSYCKSDFDYYMGKIASVDKGAWNYLNALSPRQWSRHAFRIYTKSDELTNNSAESFNKDILELRSKPIITLLEDIRTMSMLKFQQKREGAANYIHEFTPLAMGRLAESVSSSRFCTALYSDLGIYQVEDRDKRWVVNTLKQECGCRFWELVGIPCRHAVSALSKAGELPEMYISKYYSLDLYRKCYEGVIQPLPSSEQWEKTFLDPLKPPIVKSKTGRPAIRRRRSKGEDIDKPRTRAKSQQCSNCKEVGHEYTYCPQTLKEGLKIRKTPSRENGKRKLVDEQPQQKKRAVDEQNVLRVGTPNVGAVDKEGADGGRVDEEGADTRTNLQQHNGRKQKCKEKVKLTACRAKRRKELVGNLEVETSQPVMENEVPRYVKNNQDMGIVYGDEAPSQGSQQAKKRGRPKKHKQYEGTELRAAVKNNNLKRSKRIAGEAPSTVEVPQPVGLTKKN